MSYCNSFNNFMSGFIQGMNLNTFYNNPFACNNFMPLSFGSSMFNSFYNPSFFSPYQFNNFSLPTFTIPIPTFNHSFNQTNLNNNLPSNNYLTTNDVINTISTVSVPTFTPTYTSVFTPAYTPQIFSDTTTKKTTSKRNTTQIYDANDNIVITSSVKDLKAKWKSKNSNLSDKFYQKVINIAERIKCSPNDLMALMHSESGLKSTAVNKKSNATGLIQFMPETAEGLGTSVEKLKSMSPERQLDYVEKYLVQAKKSRGFSDNQKIDAGTLYALVFLPKYARQEVLCSRGNKAYSQNIGLDKNKDGKITKSELGNRLTQYYA